MDSKLRILLADDEEVIHQTIGTYFRNLGHYVEGHQDGISALNALKKNEFDLAVVDVRMPKMDGMTFLKYVQNDYPEIAVIIISGHGDMDSVIQAIRAGAVDFICKPVKLIELETHLNNSLIIHGIKQERQRFIESIKGIQLSGATQLDNIRYHCTSPAMCKVREQVKQAVDADVNSILITGETGTGKEVIARDIHFHLRKYEHPFIAINCPSLTDSLVESELFGHVKGAFTGASQGRAGYFEMAHGGTLFLDEIADLTQAAQASILRVLETRRLRRVGGLKEIKVDVRVVAATNAPLKALMSAGKFRKDLYFRLNVFPIHVEPLRQRPGDIIPFAKHFLSCFATSRNLKIKELSKDAIDCLTHYDFPGNVRELRYLVERAAIVCRSESIEADHLNILKKTTESNRLAPVASHPENEINRLQLALENTKWNRRQAARDLNMPYSTLMYKLKRLDIK